MKQLLYAVAAFLAGCIVTAIFFTANMPDMTTTRTVTVNDTIPYYIAVVKDSTVVRYETHRLPTDTSAYVGREVNFTMKTDSADVVIPITQKEYKDSTYHVWISGYAANLDSIHTYTRHDYTTVTLAPAKPKRWHLGVTAGFAVTPKGAQPYVGCGITYSFKSF